MKLRTRFLSACAAAALVLGASAPAKAILLTVTSSNASTTTATGGSGAGERAAAQSLSVSDNGGSTADVIGNTINMASRYVSNASADRGGPAFGGGSAVATVNTDYTLTFTVSGAFSGQQWSTVVDTRLRGGLTALDDQGWKRW
jgi:hypothetical protein